MSYEILSPQEFGARLSKFCDRHVISLRHLETLCGNSKNLSRSSLSRILHNEIRPEFLRFTFPRVLPLIENALERYLYNCGFDATDINKELNKLFPDRSEREMIANRCELPAEAVRFFGLKQDPFDVDRIPSDDELFTNSDLDKLADRVKDAVLYRRFLAVIGPVGSGKTSLKIRVARELSDTKHEVRLLYPEFFDMNVVSVGAIARYILEEFETKCPADSAARVRKIKSLLTSLHNEDVRVCLVFDECHRLNDKVLSSLKNFWELTNGGYSRLLGIVLLGQPKFVESTMRDYKFREIAERVKILQMPSLQKSAQDYLSHKLSANGGDIELLFEQKALDRICRLAKTPLALGNLTNEALLEAFKLKEKRVMNSMLKLPEMPQVKSFRKAD